ncbi:MAG TPA: hypothetical protein VMD02_06990 [Candidatus Omnitrophota bacterium]|nr:hypothetical protein [Candidatus Omnitrophota bacterium]
MKIFVNDTPYELPEGGTVKDALNIAGLHKEARSGKPVLDGWGTEMMPEAVLKEGIKLFTGRMRKWKR